MAYLGLDFGVFKLILERGGGVFAWQGHAFDRGFGGMFRPENCLKLLNLVRLGV